MTLFNANIPDEKAQTHVLIIGVGLYPFLPEGGGPIATKTLGLKQLTSPPISASVIADWALGELNNLDAPLGSVELLLSQNDNMQGEIAPLKNVYKPGVKAALKLGVDPGTAISTPLAEFSEIKQAFGRWFERLNRLEENIALFYFCGHGVEAADRYLLPSDYGKDKLVPFSEFINFTQTFNKMNRCKAQTQCWFLDCCRDQPSEVKSAAATGSVGQSLIGDIAGGPFSRNAPIFHAAAIGKSATGPPGKQSYFVEALTQCLNGTGVSPRLDDSDPYAVSTASLGSALSSVIPWLEKQNFDVSMSYEIGGSTNLPPKRIHFPAEPFEVLASILCIPDKAHTIATLDLADSQGISHLRGATSSEPWRLKVHSGACTIKGTFASDFKDFAREVRAFPPIMNKTIQVDSQGDA